MTVVAVCYATSSNSRFIGQIGKASPFSIAAYLPKLSCPATKVLNRAELPKSLEKYRRA